MKIICVGRNYSEHAKELNNEIPDEPVLFLKPDSSLMRQRDKFYIPSFTQEVNYEAELVIRINRIGKNIQEKFAHKYFQQFTLGIDFTAPDIQRELKAKGLPWEKAKAFDQSAVVGKWLNKSDYDLSQLSFELIKNGELVQKGNSSAMIFNIHELIAYISKYFTLKIGDLIYTGTPAGVGEVVAYDVLKGTIAGAEVLNLDIR